MGTCSPDMAAPSPKYSYIFNFEKEFQDDAVAGWMEESWLSVCSWSTAVYLIFVLGGQAAMKDRPPFDLRMPLAVWSCSLAIFSLVGAVRTWTELVEVMARGGIYQAVCT